MKQQTTALSTVEAEHFSKCQPKEALRHQNFLQEILSECLLNYPQNVYVDNQGAISLAKNHATSECNKVEL